MIKRPTIRIAISTVTLALLVVGFSEAPLVHGSEIDSVKKQIESIGSSVEEKKQTREEIASQAQRYRSIIMSKELESASIEDEIGLIDSNIAKNQLDIEIAVDQIRGLELETRLLSDKIVEHEQMITNERRLMSGLARKLHRSQFNKSPFEALLNAGSLSDFFDAWQSMASLQSSVRKAADKLKESKIALENERDLKETKQVSIKERRRGLEVAKRELEDSKMLKQSLLLETKSSEIEFRYALAELEKEQSEADSEIKYLERVLREKQELISRLGRGTAVLSWPVDPSRGITARFHDPEYPYRNVFEHPGIDIRCYQGSPVRAAAAGVVARAKDGGMGYSYVMLLHSGGVSTVYGHLSKIYVREDSYVERGEVIGLSGGMPGTPGAGRLTTGPHFHFEVRSGGIPADPLKFLP